jgi:predicted transposase YbfD/YdcC
MNTSFEDYFSTINDPRVEGRIDYPLLEIIFLCVCSIICGMDGWEDIEDFGHSKLNWLRKFFPFENGIPRHDTVARVISRLSPTGLQNSFIEWAKSISELTDGEVIAIDGKRVRRSYDKRNKKSAIHMVSAWACSNGIVLGQQKTEDKSNEITAIPKLLEVLEIKGCIVTIDAMGCQKNIAKAITDKEADYVLALKGNQSSLHKTVEDLFEKGFEDNFENLKIKTHHDVNKGHGRIEKRTCYALEIPKNLNRGVSSVVCK